MSLNTEFHIAAYSPVVKVETVYEGGGAFADIITLSDGRVIGINENCIVLYGSIEEFYDKDSDLDLPTINFV